MNGSLTWNPNGSLQNFSLTDSSDSTKNQNCGYHTDDINRLSSVNCAGSWAQNFTYDPFGNITKSAPTNPGPGQLTQTYQPGGYTVKYQISNGSYDSNGNQSYVEGVPTSWNANGQPASFFAANEPTNAIYDALGRLVGPAAAYAAPLIGEGVSAGTAWSVNASGLLGPTARLFLVRAGVTAATGVARASAGMATTLEENLLGELADHLQSLVPNFKNAFTGAVWGQLSTWFAEGAETAIYYEGPLGYQGKSWIKNEMPTLVHRGIPYVTVPY